MTGGIDQAEHMGTTAFQAWRLSFYFGAVFAVVGVMAPFWPVFLKARGLSAPEIGLLLSAGLWLRVILNPMIAQLADRRGERRRPLLILTLMAMLGFSCFLFMEGFWGLLAVNLIASVAFSSIIPLGETVVLRAVYRLGLDYGRLRIWGSLTFIATSFAGGPMLAVFGSWSVLWAILALLVGVLLACALLPEESIDQKAKPAQSGDMWKLLRHPVFLLFLLAGGLGNAGHAVLYGFATLHWRSAGFSDVLIGALWAEGVVAEIVLFWLGNRLLSRFGAANLLALGAAAGIIRWTAMGFSDALWVALLTQALHAFTFGAAHLGAMHFIARAAPEGMAATAQSLHGAVGAGIAVGLVMAVAGLLYENFANGAYFFMAAIACVSLLAALLLAKIWDGKHMDLS
ncbi:MAG: MFS transporter [Rhodospirillaceae bacterium]|nr:MFS transporter [Rhodospirillaceae bacterium]MBT4045847.1 MFS transporter [Rhodospirillaceae bacterium]MBT4687448.1 MFS transporter [Rhodospirillaceae bacterium]MBT5079652.1 MFS transporter [Rhodospirillaceae bacterium]MBT5527151.1 MFS transporter [Rhodospirillaceae bacterium]